MSENLPVITRPTTGAVGAGVAIGLARKWQIDPTLLRVTFVVLAAISGIGVAAYAIGWLLMPRDGATEPPIHRVAPFTRTWNQGVLLAVMICLATVITLTLSGGTSSFGILAIAVAIWVIMANRNRKPGPSPTPTPYEQAAESWRQRLIEQETPGYAPAPETEANGTHRWQQPYTDPSDHAVSDYDPSPVITKPRRRWRGWITPLLLTAVAILTVTSLGVLFGFPMTALAYSSAVLAALGLGLLAAVAKGRPPLLLPTTIATALVTVALLLSATGFTPPSVGAASYSYSDGGDLPDRLDLDVGELELDLSQLRLASDETLELSLGTGNLAVALPDSVPTEVEWSVGTGEFKVNQEVAADGIEISGQHTYRSESGGPVLHLVVDVAVGEVNLTNANA